MGTRIGRRGIIRDGWAVTSAMVYSVLGIIATGWVGYESLVAGVVRRDLWLSTEAVLAASVLAYLPALLANRERIVYDVTPDRFKLAFVLTAVAVGCFAANMLVRIATPSWTYGGYSLMTLGAGVLFGSSLSIALLRWSRSIDNQVHRLRSYYVTMAAAITTTVTLIGAGAFVWYLVTP